MRLGGTEESLCIFHGNADRNWPPLHRPGVASALQKKKINFVNCKFQKLGQTWNTLNFGHHKIPSPLDPPYIEVSKRDKHPESTLAWDDNTVPPLKHRASFQWEFMHEPVLMERGQWSSQANSAWDLGLGPIAQQLSPSWNYV